MNTGNLELDMILNHKLAKAKAMSCQIQSQIVIPCQLPVDGYDWNVLFEICWTMQLRQWSR